MSENKYVKLNFFELVVGKYGEAKTSKAINQV